MGVWPLRVLANQPVHNSKRLLDPLSPLLDAQLVSASGPGHWVQVGPQLGEAQAHSKRRSDLSLGEKVQHRVTSMQDGSGIRNLGRVGFSTSVVHLRQNALHLVQHPGMVVQPSGHGQKGLPLLTCLLHLRQRSKALLANVDSFRKPVREQQGPPKALQDLRISRLPLGRFHDVLESPIPVPKP